jgi:NAD(P)H dehydrogenase (quinone)
MAVPNGGDPVHTIELAEHPARVAVIYYSARGNVHALARAVAAGAAREGAEVRLRHVAELNQEMRISAKQHWGLHRSEIEDQPDARLEDLEWADGIAFGTPTRFGNVAAQLKLFIDLAGELWQQGKLVDKVATAFTSSQTERRAGIDDSRPQQHSVSLGRHRVAARLHGARGLQRRRQPVRHVLHQRPPRRRAG